MTASELGWPQPGLTLLPAVDVASGQAVRLVQGAAGTETRIVMRSASFGQRPEGPAPG